VKLRLLGFLALLAFCYALALYVKLMIAGSFERFFFHVDAPLWLFLQGVAGIAILAFLRKRLGLLNVNSRSISRDFIVLLAFIPLIALLGALFGVVLPEKFLFGKDHDLFQWLSAILYQIILQSVAGLGCISYFYFSTLTEIRENLSAAQIAQSEMQLKILQQKVDPHFLFNNLNVLSSLIDLDPNAANEFLDKLAKLYRYILHTQNAEIVAFGEELSFAKDYLYLLQKRFGPAYEFSWQVPPDASANGLMIVPTALQSLLENVVKHNAGSGKEPLPVEIRVEDRTLTVSNRMSPKEKNIEASGTGLQNLIDRYALLTDRLIEIDREGQTFTVKLPLLEIRE
jgi:sensor histidine kinase YesM